MTKKARGEMTDREFNALVDEGFSEYNERKPRRGGVKPWCPSDELVLKLEEEGADPRLTKGAARLHGVLGRCFRSGPGPLSDASVEFLNKFDATAREAAKTAGMKLRD